MTIKMKMLQAAAGAGGVSPPDIADAFSTDLYTGNASTQTITNGIDLSGEGGLIWIKCRNAAEGHWLTDTETNQLLRSNLTNDGFSNSTFNYSYLSDGWSINTDDAGVNDASNTYAAWTFRKAPKFFDVVTYTGTGSATTVAHDIGATVGSIIIKRTDATSNWAVYHRANTAAPETDYLSINLTNATADDATYWNDTAPTDSVFTVGTNAAVNASGGTYVAYLFAHDTEDDGVVQCGSYTGNGSTDGPVITLGWEPQWLLVKGASGAVGVNAHWYLVDSSRGDGYIRPNLSSQEFSEDFFDLTATGFTVNTIADAINISGGNIIYMAIRAEA
jgi:hypothetical protein